VPLRFTLRHGDIVEIITSAKRKPSKDWLKVAKTSRARSKIRQWVKNEERTRSITLGKDMLEKELRHLHLNVSQQMKQDSLLQIAREFSFQQGEDLLAAIGFGKISIKQIINRIAPRPEVEKDQDQIPLELPKKPQKTKPAGGVVIQGVDDVLIRFGRCCAPLPGDPIIGFITRGRGITVHGRSCPRVANEDPDRLVEVLWEKDRGAYYPVKVEISSTDDKGMLAQVSTAITSAESNILKAEAYTTLDKKAFYNFTIEVVDARHLQKVLSGIKKIKGVLQVTRVYH
jgi:GTP diphosphokinase / guanosine-3',5'-bis(diphosphate) 3'-diphosphatase